MKDYNLNDIDFTELNNKLIITTAVNKCVNTISEVICDDDAVVEISNSFINAHNHKRYKVSFELKFEREN